MIVELYPNGPLMAHCRRYGWQYLIVLPDKCLPSVWEEVAALQPRLTKNRKQQQWQGRQQCFWWVNRITYSYDQDQHTLPVHVVGCEETWLEVDPNSGELITKQSRHVWISSHPLQHDNVHERCNLGARRRWGIELSIQIEKCHGYHYEHLFSQDWKALKGFHYLLRLAHLFNALAQGARRVAQQVLTLGVQAFLRFVRETCANRWLRYEGSNSCWRRPSNFGSNKRYPYLLQVLPMVSSDTVSLGYCWRYGQALTRSQNGSPQG